MSVHSAMRGVSDDARRQILDRYRSRTSRSEALHRQSQTVLPGGVGRNIVYHPPYPTFIAAAQGASVQDVDGNDYIDLLSNYTAVILGHNPPELAQTLREVPAGLNWAAPHPWEVELATELCRRIPSLEQVRFTPSATEAVMFAVRLARVARGRQGLAKFEGGYHGNSDYVLASVSPSLADAGDPTAPLTVPAPGMTPEAAQTVLTLPFNDPENTERLLRQHAEQLAAVIIEPVQGVAGIIVPEPGFLERLRAVTSELGIILIFDEVISLRVAAGGAQERFGVTPDLTIAGKIIGGGFGLGAFGGKREIMSLIDPSSSSYAMSHSGTFTGSPAAMAAGLASLQFLTPQRLEQLNARGDRFRADVEQQLRAAGLVVTVTGAGSLFNLHFVEGPVRCYRDAAAGNRELQQWFHLALLNEGVMLAPRGMGALSLAHSEQVLQQALPAFAAAAAAVQQ